MPRRKELMSSPQKQWVRRNLWGEFIKKRIETLKATDININPRYLTFPGRNALDLKLFVNRRKYFDARNVRAYEMNREFGEKIKSSFSEIDLKYSTRFEEELCQENRIDNHFYFDVINLDFTERIIINNLDRLDKKMLALQKIFWYQRRQQRSFTLFLTANGTYDKNSRVGNQIITRILEDHAKRLGVHEGYFRLAKQGLEGDYQKHLLDCLPTIIIRMGYEYFFKTVCNARVMYIPYGKPKKHPWMITLVFEADWMNPLPNLLPSTIYNEFEEALIQSQKEALNIKIHNLNKRKS